MISQNTNLQEAGSIAASYSPETATSPAVPAASLFDRAVVRVLSLRSDRRGVTALEYGIIASILGLVLVTIFKNFGSTLTKLFSTVSTSV